MVDIQSAIAEDIAKTKIKKKPTGRKYNRLPYCIVGGIKKEETTAAKYNSSPMGGHNKRTAT